VRRWVRPAGARVGGRFTALQRARGRAEERSFAATTTFWLRLASGRDGACEVRSDDHSLPRGCSYPVKRHRGEPGHTYPVLGSSLGNDGRARRQCELGRLFGIYGTLYGTGTVGLAGIPGSFAAGIASCVYCVHLSSVQFSSVQFSKHAKVLEFQAEVALLTFPTPNRIKAD